MIMTRKWILLQGICLLAAGSMLARPLYRLGRREWHQARARSVWEQVQTSPPESPASGTPVFWLSIPDRGLEHLVLSGDQPEVLAGHPGLAHREPLVILGHRDTHFRRLKGIRIAEEIRLEDAEGTCTVYRVTDLEVLSPEQAAHRIHGHWDSESLILMTCYPFSYLGPAPDRYMVWARQISTRNQLR